MRREAARCLRRRVARRVTDLRSNGVERFICKGAEIQAGYTPAVARNSRRVIGACDIDCNGLAIFNPGSRSADGNFIILTIVDNIITSDCIDGYRWCRCIDDVR